MLIDTYSCSGKKIGTKHRYDRSVPGQRCVTYHNEAPAKNKQNKIKEGK